jgi:hypothetical protein
MIFIKILLRIVVLICASHLFLLADAIRVNSRDHDGVREESVSGRGRVAIIVTGPECSGSTYIAQILAYSMDLDPTFQGWNGRGQIGALGDPCIVLHRSQPNKAHGFIPLAQFESMFPGYELKFVLCTRDRTVSAMSNLARRGKDAEIQASEEAEALRIMLDVMNSRHSFYIWSYETFMFLKSAYLNVLFASFIRPMRHIDIDESTIIDGNVKFIKPS